jgi:hypothetical protein
VAATALPARPFPAEFGWSPYRAALGNRRGDCYFVAHNLISDRHCRTLKCQT